MPKKELEALTTHSEIIEWSANNKDLFSFDYHSDLISDECNFEDFSIIVELMLNELTI